MGTEVIPKLTYEEFRQLPDDGKRYELVGGEVRLTPAPNTKHQFVVHNLDMAISPYVQKNKLGEVWEAPLDVRLTEDTALQPDLVFVASRRVEIVREEFIAGAPDLVVEVLSASTAVHDRATKLPIYAKAGVPEFWLIDSQAKTVEVLKLQGRSILWTQSSRVIKSSLPTSFPAGNCPCAISSIFAGGSSVGL